jgi:ribosomal protein L23
MEVDFIAFQLARRAVTKAIRTAVRDRYRVKVSQVKDMEGLWKLSKWQRNRGIMRQAFTPAIAHPQTQQAQQTTEGKLDAFSAAFFPKPPEADLSDTGGRYPEPLLMLKVEIDEVQAAINTTNPNKAPGPDDIPHLIIKIASGLGLTSWLTDLLGHCLRTGYCPKHFRESTTVVI